MTRLVLPERKQKKKISKQNLDFKMSHYKTTLYVWLQFYYKNSIVFRATAEIIDSNLHKW